MIAPEGAPTHVAFGSRIVGAALAAIFFHHRARAGVMGMSRFIDILSQ
jgi:hypothetical protein